MCGGLYQMQAQLMIHKYRVVNVPKCDQVVFVSLATRLHLVNSAAPTPHKWYFLLISFTTFFLSIFAIFRSFLRALVKNFSMTFLFPVFLTVFFFQHSRTVYDVIANSTVVVTGAGRLRQQGNQHRQQ